MQEFSHCHRVICARKCGGDLKLWKDNPTSRCKICTVCGQVYFFPPSYECDYHDHETYTQEEPEACRSGR